MGSLSLTVMGLPSVAVICACGASWARLSARGIGLAMLAVRGLLSVADKITHTIRRHGLPPVADKITHTPKHPYNPPARAPSGRIQ